MPIHHNGIVQGLEAGYDQRQHWASDYICEEADKANAHSKSHLAESPRVSHNFLMTKRDEQIAVIIQSENCVIFTTGQSTDASCATLSLCPSVHRQTNLSHLAKKIIRRAVSFLREAPSKFQRPMLLSFSF